MTTTKAKTRAPKKTKAKVKAVAKPEVSTPAQPSDAAVAPVAAGTMQPVVSHSMMRKRELIDLVVERSGIKKKFAKPVIEAVLAELGDALAANRELNLQPMGKLMVRRAKQTPNGRVLVTKIRQSNDTARPDDADTSVDVAKDLAE